MKRDGWNRLSKWRREGAWVARIGQLVILLALFGMLMLAVCVSFSASAQGQSMQNTFNVAQFTGRTVAAKTAAAQAQCNSAYKCVLIFDPILAVYPLGSMPSKGASEFWADYAAVTGNSDLSGGTSLPAQGGQSGKFLSTNGTSASWNAVTATPGGSPNDLQCNSASVLGACDTGNATYSASTLTVPKVATSGANGGIDGTEGTCAGLTAGAGHDLLCANSSAHRWQASNNNGSFTNVALVTDAIVKAQSPLTTKGDLWVTDGTSMHRLGVGSNGQVLTADSAQTDGIKWAAAASGSSGGANVYTADHTVGAGDLGKLVVMNCSSACTLLIPPPSSSSDTFTVYSIGSWGPGFSFTVGGVTFNGGSLPSWFNVPMTFWSDGTNYFGTPLLGWGSKVVTTTASAPVSQKCVEMDTTGALVIAASNGPCGSGSGLSSTLTSAHVFVGDGSNVAQDVALTGDVSITNGGVATVNAVKGKAADTPTTKGDVYVYDGSALKRLGVGSNTQVLTADSTAATGVKWAAAAGGSTATILAFAMGQENTSNIAMQTNKTLCWGPFQNGPNLTFGEISAYVSTTDTGNNSDVGIYTLNSLTPGTSTATLLAHKGAAAFSATSGFKIWTISGGGTATVPSATWWLYCATSASNVAGLAAGAAQAPGLYNGTDMSSTTSGGALNASFTLPASPSAWTAVRTPNFGLVP